jgi:U3 small nucleolar RNA-associated protein 11
LRARDFHRKERTIKRLQRKAEERNPDEFYHAMEKKRTKNGVHAAGAADAADSGANKYTQEELALMRTQDARYVGSRATAEAGRIERMRASLHFIGATDGLGGGEDDEDESDDEGDGGRPLKRARHTVFVDSPAEAAAFSAEEFFDTPGQLIGRAHNRPRRSQLKLIAGSGGGGGAGGAGGAGAPAAAAKAAAIAQNEEEKEDQARLRRAAEAAAQHERALLLAAAAAADAEQGGVGKRRLEKARAAAYAELAQREDRARRLRRVEEHLALARAVSGAKGKGSGRHRKLRREQMASGTPVNVKVFKWKRERRR